MVCSTQINFCIIQKRGKKVHPKVRPPPSEWITVPGHFAPQCPSGRCAPERPSFPPTTRPQTFRRQWSRTRRCRSVCARAHDVSAGRTVRRCTAFVSSAASFAAAARLPSLLPPPPLPPFSALSGDNGRLALCCLEPPRYDPLPVPGRVEEPAFVGVWESAPQTHQLVHLRLRHRGQSPQGHQGAGQPGDMLVARLTVRASELLKAQGRVHYITLHYSHLADALIQSDVH